MKRFFAVGALLLAMGASVRADDSLTATINNPGTGPNVVGPSGDTGQGLSNYQYAGSFNVIDNTTPGNFTAFCADTTDEVSFGQTNYTGTVTFGGLPNSVPDGIWSNSPFGNTGVNGVGNHLDYILNDILAPAEAAGLTNAEASAIQGAIWQTMSGYVTSQGVTDPLVLAIDQLVLGNTVTGSSWAFLNSLAAYSSGTSYASSSDFIIMPDANIYGGNPLQYQILIGVIATPEPSTLAIAGLGGLGFIVYGWKRRKRS